MSHASLYDEEYFVLLDPSSEERILSAEELIAEFEKIFVNSPEVLPPELLKIEASRDRAVALRDDYCELEIAPGETLQWYAIRLEK